MSLRKIAVRAVFLGSVAGSGLLAGSAAFAQTPGAVGPMDQQADQSQRDTDDRAAPGQDATTKDIIVTGSRIQRAGFTQPTPTTVVGSDEIRQAAQVNIQQALNELPQIRNSVSPNQSIANTTSGTAPVELRGLGTARTLTLVDGRRFVGDNNLNFVPTNLVERVEIVTGGASAAWGSGAVAGVVNIILNDKLEGLTLGAQTGLSSRGDGFRYGFDGSFGTHFGGGRGHFMIGAEYVDDKGIGVEGRSDRPWFGAGIVPAGNGQSKIQPNVNDLVVAGQPITFGGTILTGTLAGSVFDNDGSIHAARPSDFISFYGDTLLVQSPLHRLGSYARVTYGVGKTTLWADVSYGRTDVNQPFLPDPANSVLAFSISATNPFLSSQIQQQLADGGDTSFLMARLSRDAFLLRFDAHRQTVSAAVGVKGDLGGNWKYDAHFSHGVLTSHQKVLNSAIPGNFANAINAVSSGGQIVCGINADSDPANDDPACVPFDPFGDGAPSPEARAYATGTQISNTTDKLDEAAAQIQGEPFSLWAGPVSIAIGAEARWESRAASNGALDRAGIFGTPLFAAPVEGKFNVKEGFAEVLVPLLNTDPLKLDFNGGARYSDYSLSGGIWSWKLGGTARLFHDVLLRATRSRDIRAPGISDLFAVDTFNIRPVVDQDTAGRLGTPGYNPNPSTVTIHSGGNRNLVPEVARTWTVGGSFSPSFLPGVDLSVDYYDIRIANAITTPSGEDITSACAAGDTAACARVVRDASGTITTVYANSQNISRFQTTGFDFEAAYRLPLSRVSSGMSGTLSFRALATYVDKLVFQTGSRITNPLGDVGDPVQNGLPKWRANFSAIYQGNAMTLDARVRYVGGGKFNHLLNLVNNDIHARTYLDLGTEFHVNDRFTLSMRVNNLFDVHPPLITTTYSAFYDVIGRYYTAGVRVHF